MISLVIPAYNAARFLPSALESVLSQDCPDTEIIVVDDGSTDATGEVLRRYAGRIRAIRQPNAGLACARNAGLAMAQGRYIVFLDADDLLGAGVLAAQRRFLEQRPEVGAAVCRNKLFHTQAPDGKPIASGEWRLFREHLPTHLCHFNMAPVHAVLVRRHWVETVGSFDASLAACEDHDFWFRCALAGCRFAANPQGLVYYRRHPDSMSASRRRQNQADAVMHLRIGRSLDVSPEFPPGRRGCAWLANAAGSCLTAARLAEYGDNGAYALMRNAEHALARAAAAGTDRQDPLPSLFIARIRYACRLPSLAGLAANVRLLVDGLPHPARDAGDAAAREQEILRLERALY